MPQPTAPPPATCYGRKEFIRKYYCGRRIAECTATLLVCNALANLVSTLLQASDREDEKCGGCEQCDKDVKLSACVCSASVQYLMLPFTAWPKQLESRPHKIGYSYDLPYTKIFKTAVWNLHKTSCAIRLQNNFIYLKFSINNFMLLTRYVNWGSIKLSLHLQHIAGLQTFRHVKFLCLGSYNCSPALWRHITHFNSYLILE